MWAISISACASRCCGIARSRPSIGCCSRSAHAFRARLPSPAGDGRIAPLASQTGTGAFEPLVGLSWLASIRETQLLLSVQGAFPTTGFGGWRNGPVLRSSASLQWHPIPELALRATLDARLEGPSGRGQELSGESFVLHAGGGVVIAPSSDVVLHLVARVPALQVLDTAHRARADGVTIEAGVGLDV